ncbi:MAG: hypothetical protein ACI9GM_000327 [Salibacteraceae bacterium]|jgi:hypothetical protein
MHNVLGKVYRDTSFSEKCPKTYPEDRFFEAKNR